MDTYIFALLVCLSYIYRFRSDATINVVAASREACVGEDELIPWKYSNSSDTKNVIWSFTNSTVTNENVMVKVGSGNATVQNNFNIEHNGEGSVTLKAVSFVNEGIYKCAVSYTILSGHQAATGTTTVTILEPPSGLGYTDVDSVIKCTATSLGTPSASLYLKVNGKNVGVSAKVDSGKKAECCLNGKSVKCMTTASCVTVRDTNTTIPANPSNTTESNSSDSDQKKLIIGLCVGIGVVVIVGTPVIMCICCRHKKMSMKTENSYENRKSQCSENRFTDIAIVTRN